MKTRLNKSELWPEKLPNYLKNRIKGTIDFLSSENLSGKIADCGENNPLKKAIENYFNIKIYSLDWNFNTNIPLSEIGWRYDIIFCFEVLEHLFNPLLLLNNLTWLLKESGIIYLSTPRQWPQLIKSVHHYHEIPTDRLLWLFEKAGLNIKKQDKITIAGNWYNHIHGIRPLLRYFQKTRVYKLRKYDKCYHPKKNQLNSF
jgi:SAM-dependent methyltransferase